MTFVVVSDIVPSFRSFAGARAHLVALSPSELRSYFDALGTSVGRICRYSAAPYRQPSRPLRLLSVQYFCFDERSGALRFSRVSAQLCALRPFVSRCASRAYQPSF